MKRGAASKWRSRDRGVPSRFAMSSAALTLVASATQCSRHEPPPPRPVPAVTVVRPVQQEVVEWDEYSGHLEAVEFVEVRARVSGLIVSAPFQSGAVVQ